MYLTRIDILKYKSIKNTVSVYFNEGKVVTLIGKNGSGKTNVLEAIKFALSRNRTYITEKQECKIKYYIELSDDEIEDYFSCVQAEKVSKQIVVEFNGLNPEIRQIDAPILEVAANNFRDRLNNVLIKYKEATKKYLKKLKEIESFDSYFGGYLDLQVKESNRGSLLFIMDSRIGQIERDIRNQIKEIQDYIFQIFKENKINLNSYKQYYPSISRLWDITLYQIPDNEEIKISPIVAKSLNISKKKLVIANQKLNEEIRAINLSIAEEYNAAKAQIDEFEKLKKEIADIFDAKLDEHYAEQEMVDKKFASIFESLRDTVFKNCYYIDNENALIFYNSNDRAYRNEQKIQENINSRNPIIEAFEVFLRNKGLLEEKENLSQNNNWDNSLIKRIIKELNTDFLSNLIPSFDNDEIRKFEVKYEEGRFNLYVQEKDGENISFNNTSLGRRWYLTYQFIKALLRPGDMLLIDEPAAFLHPQAQTEFKIGLNDLASNGIYVFYSTHSPYMIPENWGQVYNVIMTESGTQIEKFESGDDLCEVIKHELGAINTANILFNLGKTILLVEGVSDMTCLEKFAEILGYNLKPYKILPCNGSPIFDVTYLCINQGVKFKALFDLDNKNKPEMWMNRKYGYNEYIKIFDTNTDCVFTPAIRQKKSLEDCFHEKDNARYFTDHRRTAEHVERKIDIDKIKQASEFEEETKGNFEQLFKKLGIPELDGSKS